MLNILSTPVLPLWAQQLASNLPLCALIEFINIETKLHVFQLNNYVPLWNWPITPIGARCLLSQHDTEVSCCLDSPELSRVLECFDGRHGVRYPCSAPTTTRLWCSSKDADTVLVNESSNMKDLNSRRQKLQVFHVVQRVHQVATNPRKVKFLDRIVRNLVSIYRGSSIRYYAMLGGGWIIWASFVAIAFVGQLYFSGAYMIFMPITGLLVRQMHGGKPRRPLNQKEGRYDRMIVATNSLNASVWWAFYGKSNLLNSMLNKPLRRNSRVAAPKALRNLLRFCITAQWVLVLGACALQGWDAFIISIWIGLCAIVSSYVYPPELAASDWLHYHCDISVTRTDVELSTRRSMLSALVAMNPDTVDGSTRWMDAILEKTSPNRQDWESSLLQYIAKIEIPNEEDVRAKYWWKYIAEGVEIGEKLKVIMKS